MIVHARIAFYTRTSDLLAAVETPLAEPGEKEYSGYQKDPADPEYPEDGGVRANERIDQQEAEGQQGNQDPYPRCATPHSHAEASTPAISISTVRRSTGIGSAITRSTAGRSATGNSDALVSLHLGELADLVTVFPRVLARVDPLRLQVLRGCAEDLGEVGANPFLAVLLPITALNIGVAACRDRVDVRVSHVCDSARTRPKSR